MGVIVGIFDWIYKKLRACITLIASISGQIVAAIASVVAVVGSMFSRFTWLDGATQWVNSATQYAGTLAQSSISPFMLIVIGFIALDRLLQVMAVVLACTIGVTCLVFVTLFLSVFALVPVTLGIRAILKAIKTASVGFLDP